MRAPLAEIEIRGVFCQELRDSQVRIVLEEGRLSRRDEEQVRRLLNGDESAFVELVRTHQASLTRLARVFVRDAAIAEEVVQETWLAVLSGLRGFEGRSTLKTWIFRILVNRARTRATRESRTVAFAELGLDADEVEAGVAVERDRFTPSGKWARPPAAWDVDTPEEILLRQETLAVVETTVEELPPRQRLVITLRDMEGMDAREACDILGITETHQRVLLHRARSKVRSSLESYLERK